MAEIAWAFWVGLLAIIVIIFWRLWVLAARIERDEQEEREWIVLLERIKYENPEWYFYYEDQFKQRFKLK